MPQRGKLSRPPEAPKVIRYTGGLSLTDGLGTASVRTKSRTQVHRVRQRHPSRRRPLRPVSTQSVQTFTYTEDQLGLEPERHITMKPPVKPPHMEQLVVSMSPVQISQVTAVQRTEMKDVQVLGSSHFHFILLLASQHSVVTMDPCWETQHRNQQLDWTALTCCS